MAAEESVFGAQVSKVRLVLTNECTASALPNATAASKANNVHG